MVGSGRGSGGGCLVEVVGVVLTFMAFVVVMLVFFQVLGPFFFQFVPM